MRFYRAILCALTLCLLAQFAPVEQAQAKSVRAIGARSVGGGGGGFSDVPLPSGALGFTAQNWLEVAGASGYIVYCTTSSQLYPDSALYAYQYVVTSGATLSKAVTGVAAGTYYCRVAAYAGSIIYDLGPEVLYTAA